MGNKDIKSITLNTSAQSDTTNYTFSVGLYIFKEGDYYIAYSPAFDLSSYAETSNEAIAAFYEAFQMHVEYCVAQNTLAEDLKAKRQSTSTLVLRQQYLRDSLLQK